MPGKDGTGPDGNGPKKNNQGTPTPRRRRTSHTPSKPKPNDGRKNMGHLMV